MKHNRPTPSMVFSLFLILAGVLLVFDNFGILRSRELLRFWPVVFIVMGLSSLDKKQGFTGYTWSFLLIACGTLMLLAMFHVRYITWGLTWPFILISFGLLSLAQTLDRKGFENCMGRPVDSSESTLQEFAIFSGAKRRIETQNFKGGEMVAVFGGIEIDLRRAALPPGEPASIDVRVAFGGVNMRIPENWKVVIRGLAVFGAYEDKTIPPRPDGTAEPPTLILTGTVIFGGVNVEN